MTCSTVTADLAAEVRAAANIIHARYSDFVSYDDVLQEIHLYALGGGAKYIQKWLADDEPHRVRLALRGAGKRFCEKEKAQQSGYSPDDVAWYSPEKVAEILPHALNPKYDGLSGDDPDSNGHRGAAPGREGGGMLAMIVDVRRAVDVYGKPLNDSDGEYDAGYLERLSEFLGGDYPNAPGYTRTKRDVVSTARALRNLNNYDGRGER